nr:hypothetical protein [Tanacetum cinerariifolium]
LLTIDPKDKGKGVLVEEEPQKLEKEELVELDIAQKERQNQKEATIAALTEEFNEIQARMDTDHELAKKMAVKRAEAIKNKPPTRTQVKNMMITYLKHMGKYTHQQLKHNTFEELLKLYQKEQKWIDDFVPMDYEKEEKKSVEPEKIRYPLIKEILKKMLNWKLEVEAESTMAFKLLKFIKSHVEE